MKIDRNKIHQKFDKHCAYCGCELPDESGKYMHVDHIRPVYRNISDGKMYMAGNHTPENLYPSCVRCNLYKSTLSIEHFREAVKNSYHVCEKVTAFNNAVRFGMIEFKEWDGLFYFEKFNK